LAIDRWIRKEQVVGRIWFFGEDGFGPEEPIPSDVSKVNFFWGTDESPLFSSPVYSTQWILHLDPDFPKFAEDLSALLNESHAACRQGSLNKQPRFWMYPFVRPRDCKPDRNSYSAFETNFRLDKVVRKLLIDNEIGEKFHRTIFCRFVSNTLMRLSCRDVAPRSSSRKWVMFNHDVWSSELELSDEQWRSAIQKLEEQKKAEIDAFIQQLEGGQASGVRIKITEAVRSEVWRRDGGRCVQCTGNEKLEFDHVIPISRGGSDTARNLQLLCETCNRKKGASI